MHPFTSAIILAAGKSTRFPGNKLTYEIDIEGVRAPLIRHTVVKFINSKVFHEIVVVLGFSKDLVEEALRGLRISLVYNEAYDAGMSTSVVKGVESVIHRSDLVAIHPGDVPYVRVETLRDLVEYALDILSLSNSFIVVPRLTNVGRGGHPLIVGRGLIQEILKVSEEEMGLKGFLKRNYDKVLYHDTDDVGVLKDVDVPEDLNR
ncbi:MAG: nucleotidyltransferase family protein [Zestosphaera sp.]